MGLNAVRVLTFSNGGDLSNATVSSEVVDVRDLKIGYGVLTWTGAPTGSMQIITYLGHPIKTATGLDWTTNDFFVPSTISFAGTPNKAQISFNGQVSAFQLVYTRTSGSGAVRAVWQSKGGGTS